jgi:hypothetical protein
MPTATNPANAFSPVVLNPGASTTISVTITPSAAAGTVVRGTLYVDTFSGGVPTVVYSQAAGDEMPGLPYEYTVGG